MNKFFFVSLILLLTSLAAFGQNTGSIRGTVTSQVNGTPLSGVSVQVTQLNRSAETDAQGKYEFTALAPGRYTLVTHIEGFSDHTLNRPRNGAHR